MGSRPRSACASCGTTSRSRAASPASRRTRPTRSAWTTRSSSWPSTRTTPPSSWTSCRSSARPSRAPTRRRRRRSSPASARRWSERWTRWTARRSGRRRSVLRGLEQLVERAQLHPRPALRLAGLPLHAVHGLPAGVAHGIGLALGEQRLHRVAVGIDGRAEPAGVEVGQHRVDCLLRVALVRSDDPGGPALDPADGVLARAARDAPVLVGNRAGLLIERHAGNPGAAVADRAEDEAAVQFLCHVRWLGAERAVVALDELVADESDALHALAAEDLHGRDEEAQHDAPPLA